MQTFEIDKTRNGITVCVWEYRNGNTRLDAMFDISMSEARELSSLLTAHIHLIKEPPKESMGEFMTKPFGDNHEKHSDGAR